MTSVILQEFAKTFAEQGRAIKEIRSKSDILFAVHPFQESFLGWDRLTLSHFTVLDCLPLADLTEEEIVSGSPKLREAVLEAIEAVRTEEERANELKRKARSMARRNNQMVWF